MTRYDYTIHPLADVFPELPANEFEQLKENIQKNGQLEPIVISREHLLLDGRHRMKACQELAITPRTIYFDDVPHIGKMSEADYIWSKNILRRHLTDGQRAAIAHKWSDAEREAAQQRQKAGVRSPSGESAQRSRDAVAKKAKVSTYTVRQVEALAKRDPKARDDVAAGKKSLKQALSEVLPRKPKPKPKPIVDVEPRKPEAVASMQADQGQISTLGEAVEVVRRCLVFFVECSKSFDTKAQIFICEELSRKLNMQAESLLDDAQTKAE